MQLQGCCTGRLPEFAYLKTLVIKVLDQKLLEFARSEGLYLSFKFTIVIKKLFDEILRFHSQSLLTRIADWFQQRSCQTLVIATDVAKNVGCRGSASMPSGSFFYPFRTPRVTLIPMYEILMGAKVRRRNASRSANWVKTERSINQLSIVDTERAIFNNHVLIFVCGNGWSAPRDDAISRLTDFLLKLGGARRLNLREFREREHCKLGNRRTPIRPGD